MSQPPAPERLNLDDLKVGDVFESGEHRMEADAMVAFAATFDPQPFHTDPDAAGGTFFRGLAASGWHTGAVSMRLIVESVPFADGIIGAGGTIEWPTPTRPGDVLRVRSEVLEITPSRSRPDRAVALVRSVTRNQDGEVRQEFTSRMLVFRRAR